jgi:hypothetical protein
MTTLELDCCDVEDGAHKCISVDSNSSISDVISISSAAFGKSFTGMCLGSMVLSPEFVIADYFEADVTYSFTLLPVGLCELPSDCLLVRTHVEVAQVGVVLEHPTLLMSASVPYQRGDFNRKVAGKGPTLLLVEGPAGRVSGGFASVPWPKFGRRPIRVEASDLSCFVFGLKPEVITFKQCDEPALETGGWWAYPPNSDDDYTGWVFGFGSALSIGSPVAEVHSGCEGSWYSGLSPRVFTGEERIGGSGRPCGCCAYVRWEMWAL